MPFSTSRRPKLLCTDSALTMGVGLTSAMLARQRNLPLGRQRRRCVERDEHPSEPLERRQRKLTLRAPGIVTLDVVLPDGEDRGHDQVPDAGHDRKFDDGKVEVRDLVRPVEQLIDSGRRGERACLEHRDRFVAGRRDDDPHRLRENDALHHPEARHPQRSESTRLNSSHSQISYAVFCLKKKKKKTDITVQKQKIKKKKPTRPKKTKI